MKAGLALLGAVIAQVVGLLLLRRSVVGREGLSLQSLSQLLSVLLSVHAVVGVFFFGVGLIFWLLATSRLDLSLAYPVASGLQYVLIAVFSRLLFSETLPPLRVMGMAVIVLGVVMVSWSRA